LTLALGLIALALALQPVIWALVFFIALQTASAGDGTPPTQPSEDQMSQAVKDKLAELVAAFAADKAAAVEAEKANHQSEVDAAKAEAAQAESDEGVSAIQAEIDALSPPAPAPEPAPEG